jgi:hypothetical protein
MMDDVLLPLGIDIIDQGRLIEQVNEEILRACKDVLSRPNLDKNRKVTVTTEIKPDLDQESGQNWPTINWGVSTTLPAISRKGLRALVRNGEVLLNTSPHFNDPEKAQMSLLEFPTQKEATND